MDKRPLGLKKRLGYRHDGQKGNIMNYRLIVHYEDTGVVTIQQRGYFRGIETIDHYGDVGRWKNDNWDE